MSLFLTQSSGFCAVKVGVAVLGRDPNSPYGLCGRGKATLNHF